MANSTELETSSYHLWHAVTEAGESIKLAARHFETKDGESHRSGVTASDLSSQEKLIGLVTAHFPNAVILTEEKSSHPMVLDWKNPAGILLRPGVVIMDPIDSTVSFANDLATWCVAAGLMVHGEMVASALYAPAINDGMAILSWTEGGVYVREWKSHTFKPVAPSSKATQQKSWVVAFGIDATLYRTCLDQMPGIAAKVRAVTVTPSGLLGLGQLALGRLQAVVQTPQKPWDWAPMYRAVLESGKIFKFFRLVAEGDTALSLEPVEMYDARAFAAGTRENRLGFVAGEREVVEWIFSLLPKRWLPRE